MNLDKMLTREVKEGMILSALVEVDPRLDGEIASVSYDRRFGFDFEVVKGPAGKPRVTFSLSIGDDRFAEVLGDCASACYDVRFTTMAASAVRGGTRTISPEVDSV